MLFQRWPTVCDAGPTLKRHLVSISCLLGISYHPTKTRYFGLMYRACWVVAYNPGKKHFERGSNPRSPTLQAGSFMHCTRAPAVHQESNIVIIIINYFLRRLHAIFPAHSYKDPVLWGASVTER